MQAGADPTIESFFSETAMEVAQQELAYWLVDTAEVQSVLGSRVLVVAAEAAECRTIEDLKAALQQQTKTAHDEVQAAVKATAKHKSDCEQMKAELEHQKKTAREEKEAMMKATSEHASNRSQCCACEMQ